jgi:hypothetical protein
MGKKLLRGKFSGEVYIDGKLCRYPDVNVYETETEYVNDILIGKIIKTNGKDTFIQIGLSRKRKIINFLIKIWGFFKIGGGVIKK